MTLPHPPSRSTPPAAHVMRHAAQAVQHGPRDRGQQAQPAPLIYHHCKMGPERLQCTCMEAHTFYSAACIGADPTFGAVGRTPGRGRAATPSAAQSAVALRTSKSSVAGHPKTPKQLCA